MVMKSKMNKYLIILSLFVLASCTNPTNSKHNNGSDTAFSNIPVNVLVRKNKTFNYTKLFGEWVFIAGRDSGDSSLASFMKDTDQSKSKYGYFRVDNYDSTGKWHLREDDIGYEGTYVIDTLTNDIKAHIGYPKQVSDTTYCNHIVYLDKNYLITTYTYQHKKHIEFLMNIKARNNWKFAKGG